MNTCFNLEALIRGLNARQSGNGSWMAHCPVHDDKNPSLSISQSADGTLLLHCFAGCGQGAVIEALRARGLWPEGSSTNAGSGTSPLPEGIPSKWKGLNHVAQWAYRDPAGNIMGYVVRYGDGTEKQVIPFFKREGSRWKAGGADKPRPLYGLDRLAKHPEATVLIVEGEKAADAAQRLLPGLVCMTSPGGSKAAAAADWSVLKGRSVIIWPDNDPPGKDYGNNIARNLLKGVSPHRKIIDAEALDLGEKGDAADWPPGRPFPDPPPLRLEIIDRNGTEEWVHHGAENGKGGTSDAGEPRASENDHEPTILEWPELQPDAMRGFAGDFVRLATRKCEADPAAVLITFLSWFAVEAGKEVFLRVGDTRHYPRIFACVVGDTSKARKGTSHGPVRRLFGGLSSHTSLSSPGRYVGAHCSPGPLSTGEGLIYAVRDPVQRLVCDKKTGETSLETIDPGVGDKRLFVCDEELGGALSCTRREGNTLSTVLRCTWDHGNLDPLTKTSKITATGAHIGIVGHITRAELRRKLEEAEAFNGFANRFLWVCARRHGLVPFPEPMPHEELKEMQRRLYSILMAGKDVGEMSLSLEARNYWTEIYPEVSEDRDGLAGAVINRGEAQMLRLSMIYALLDGSPTIEVDHMRSAKALWDYCRESAEYIFHGFEADPFATKILQQVLKNGEVEWRDLYPLFSNRLIAN
jgi:hypothetical protein